MPVVTNVDVEITDCAVIGLIQPGEEDFSDFSRRIDMKLSYYDRYSP